MGNRVALVSCVKSKANSARPAQDLYTSPLFAGMRKYAEQNSDEWFILSAEHGLLRPEQVVAPYEKTLKTMRKVERLDWANRVGNELMALLKPSATVIILAGQDYSQNIIPILENRGFKIEVPMGKLKLGPRLSWLKSQVRHV